MTNMIKGSCLCGAVTFEVEDSFETYNLCHCEQCQKLSGSAHASNLFTKPDKINWLTGQEKIKQYDVPGREMRTVFCSDCGCSLPHVTHTSGYLVVPAGSLDAQPTFKPEQVIFWEERMPWYEELHEVDKFNGFRDNDY